MARLLMLGLDGGDLDYIQSRAAVLPCLAQQLKANQLFKLEAPKALSGSVWPTFYNGASPGQHGIYQHLVWDAQRMGIRRIKADWCYYKPFWQDIEQAGHSVVVLDVPYSFPVALKKGVEITDWATHGQTLPLGCTHDSARSLLQQIGKSPIGRETPIEKTPQELRKIQQQVEASAALKGDLILKLSKEVDWELFVAVFAETHRGGHTFFSDRDEADTVEDTPLLKIYQAVDRALAKIIEGVDADTTVMIFSVHGMARDYAQGHVVQPLMKKINEVFLAKYADIAPKSPLKTNAIVPYLRRVVPANLQYAVGAAVPDGVRQWVVEKEIIGGLDWHRTPGFALRTDIRTELRLNLVGREAQGILEPQSELCQQYIDFVKTSFLELRDRETGVSLVDEVVNTHQLFPGQNCEALPDLVITWHSQPPVQQVYSPLVGEVTAKPSAARGGDHTDFGFAIAPDLPPGLSSLERIEDLAQFCRRFLGVQAKNSD